MRLKRQYEMHIEEYEMYLAAKMMDSKVEMVEGNMVIHYAGEQVYPSNDPGLRLLQRWIEAEDYVYRQAMRKLKVCELAKEMEIDG